MTSTGGGKRAEQARRTRGRILDAARDLFVAHGYGSTTLRQVADAAGVAVQTVYFVFGNKRALVKELMDVTIAGDDEPVATLDRPWFRDAVAADTAPELVRRLVTGNVDILARVAPVYQVCDAAVATDPELAAVLSWDADPRYTVMTAAATELVGKPGARPGVTVPVAADTLYGLLSPELYLLMVRTRGWSNPQWATWVIELLTAQLTVKS